MASLSRAYSNTTMNTCLIFLSKAAQDPRQRSQFLSCTYCVVPRQNWTKLWGFTQWPCPSAPQWLPIGALRKDSTWPYSSTGHLLENHSKGPEHRTTIFLSNSSWGTQQSWWCLNSWYKFGNFYHMDFEKNEFKVWIHHPLWQLPR